jgi:hypothetical protein
MPVCVSLTRLRHGLRLRIRVKLGTNANTTKLINDINGMGALTIAATIFVSYSVIL